MTKQKPKYAIRWPWPPSTPVRIEWHSGFCADSLDTVVNGFASAQAEGVRLEFGATAFVYPWDTYADETIAEYDPSCAVLHLDDDSSWIFIRPRGVK